MSTQPDSSQLAIVADKIPRCPRVEYPADDSVPELISGEDDDMVPQCVSNDVERAVVLYKAPAVLATRAIIAEHVLRAIRALRFVGYDSGFQLRQRRLSAVPGCQHTDGESIEREWSSIAPIVPAYAVPGFTPEERKGTEECVGVGKVFKFAISGPLQTCDFIGAVSRV
ncbi:hypothetical protein DFH07DRAFT_781072 [Mycena maculata]|uniref:Uncharacterized protein n=1 Tax=Mycena maculata TaxID=230809 RepID=A0AAD7HZZ4_9AGAR|nr:hypothetical protein DFH07DRAFT_781072 [Mycena maculata]